MMLFRAPGGKTHLCWVHLTNGGVAAACRVWWPHRSWQPITEGGEITCGSCRRGTTITHVLPWDLAKEAPQWVGEV